MIPSNPSLGGIAILIDQIFTGLRLSFSSIGMGVSKESCYPATSCGKNMVETLLW